MARKARANVPAIISNTNEESNMGTNVALGTETGMEGADNSAHAASVIADLISHAHKAENAARVLGDGRSVDTLESDLARPFRAAGTFVNFEAPSRDIAAACGLDWSTRKSPLAFSYGPDGNKKIMVTGEYVITTDNEEEPRILVPHCGVDFKVPNPVDFIDGFKRALVVAGDTISPVARLITLNQGDSIVVTAFVRTRETYRQAVDETLMYLMLTASYKYGLAHQMYFSDTVVVCENTQMHAYNSAIGRDTTTRIGHRSEFGSAEIEGYLMALEARKELSQRQANILMEAKPNDDIVRKFFGHLFPVTGDNKKGADLSRNALLALSVDTDPKQPGMIARGDTWWRRVNTVTYMVDHMLGRTDESRIYNATIGSGPISAVTKLKALDFALVASGVKPTGDDKRLFAMPGKAAEFAELIAA